MVLRAREILWAMAYRRVRVGRDRPQRLARGAMIEGGQERKANLQERVADVLTAKDPPARAIPLEAPTRTIICPHLANWVNAANRCTACGARWKDGAWAMSPTYE